MKNTFYFTLKKVMGRPTLTASLFVGSVTKRTMIEWMKVFKIVDNKFLVEEIKNSDDYIGKDNEEEDDEDMFLLTDCLSYIDFTPHFEKLENILEKLNLKFAIDYMYQEEKFYIGRPLENVRTDIATDIALWKQYDITDIDIFAAMYNKQGGLIYSLRNL